MNAPNTSNVAADKVTGTKTDARGLPDCDLPISVDDIALAPGSDVLSAGVGDVAAAVTTDGVIAGVGAGFVVGEVSGAGENFRCAARLGCF